MHMVVDNLPYFFIPERCFHLLKDGKKTNNSLPIYYGLKSVVNLINKDITVNKIPQGAFYE